MKLAASCLGFLVYCLTTQAQQQPTRPHILGIARIEIQVSDLPAAQAFYSRLLGHQHDCNWCEQPPRQSFILSNLQVLALAAAPSPAPQDLIKQITFATDNIPALRRYLVSQHLTASRPEKKEDVSLTVEDPEGHRIGFIEKPELDQVRLERLQSVIPHEPRIIHAGLIVHDRAASDHFYRDILGFRPYWHGGMKDDEDDWVALQVPDGTDWVEYMLNISPGADKHTLGVMNHIALGVTDIQAVAERLREERIVPILEQPQLGRDGKWQLNVYDPDDTRIEFMEFTPKEKPCCSEFTGPHPRP